MAIALLKSTLIFIAGHIALVTFAIMIFTGS